VRSKRDGMGGSVAENLDDRESGLYLAINDILLLVERAREA